MWVIAEQENGQLMNVTFELLGAAKELCAKLEEKCCAVLVTAAVGELAKQKAESIAGAAGAAIGGMIILGPVGLVGGAFVKGNSVTIPVGCETFVQTAEDTSLQGVVYQE